MSCYQSSLSSQDLQKTANELITSKKLNVSYLKVFGNKCFILNKKPKSSKFAPKIEEGFLLSYASNAHAIVSFTKPPVVLKLRVT